MFKILFAIIFCLAITGCNRPTLPPIKDSSALQNDCFVLYQQFPVEKLSTNASNFDYQNSLGIREIPKEKWTSPILVLNPYMVCTYRDGIQMWFSLGKNGEGEAYYVASNPELEAPNFTTSNHFVFEQTTCKGIFKVKQDFHNR